MYVEKGSSATFLGAARFFENTVISTDLSSTSTGASGNKNDYIIRRGGAVFNKVRCILPGSGRCTNLFVYHTLIPRVCDGRQKRDMRHHVLPLSLNCMLLCRQGELVFDGLAEFVENRSLTTDAAKVGMGGGIYNSRTGTITFRRPLTARWNIAAVSTISINNAMLLP